MGYQGVLGISRQSETLQNSNKKVRCVFWPIARPKTISYVIIFLQESKLHEAAWRINRRCRSCSFMSKMAETLDVHHSVSYIRLKKLGYIGKLDIGMFFCCFFLWNPSFFLTTCLNICDVYLICKLSYLKLLSPLCKSVWFCPKMMMCVKWHRNPDIHLRIAIIFVWWLSKYSVFRIPTKKQN